MNQTTNPFTSLTNSRVSAASTEGSVITEQFDLLEKSLAGLTGMVNETVRRLAPVTEIVPESPECPPCVRDKDHHPGSPMAVQLVQLRRSVDCNADTLAQALKQMQL